MLRLVGDMLDVGILIVDRDSRVVAWNAWLESASGIPGSAVTGRPLATLAPAVIAPSGEAAFARALQGGVVVHSHWLHQWLLRFPPPARYNAFAHMQQTARIAPLRGPDGAVTGAVAFIQDVTERVASEDELRAAMREAQAANKAKSDFLAAMSHELRTPVGAIAGYTDILMEGMAGELNAVQRDHLARIKSVGAHLLHIVDEILTFARLEARVDRADIARVDANLIVREAATAVEPLARKKGLEFRVTQPDGPAYLQTDANKLRQILINLLGNAVKFTQKGTVAIEVVSTSGHVAMSVRDTGAGIETSDLQRIFEPFVQSRRSLSRTYEGTGLGLSVSRQLARLLGGDIAVQSSVGTGSVFTVNLPVERDAVASAPTISPDAADTPIALS
jgi:signal transduction histidine kinase